MKKLLITVGLFLMTQIVFSQGSNWNMDGNNNATNSSFIGTLNNEAFILKANGVEGLRIKPNGDLKVAGFDDNITNGMVWTNSNGVLKKLSFTGNNNDFLSGNGTFLSLSNFTGGWSIVNGITYTNNNVGIGTTFAPEKLTVNGNIVANGTISGTSLNVIDIITSGKEFKVNTSLCMKGIDLNDPNSRNIICGMNGDLYIQSENTSYNTIINKGNNGKVGVGVMPTESFHVGVRARFDEDVITNKIYTTRITSNDSIIAFGDSSIYLNTAYNQIHGSDNTLFKGMAIGRYAYAKGLYSTAFGYRVRVDAANSVVIGSTNPSMSSILTNGTDNSLMIGFNSNKPTLMVTSANGNNTYGNVGVGTDNPDAPLTLVSHSTQNYSYALKTVTSNPLTKAYSVSDVSSGSPVENFLVYGNGSVYCRDVYVKLGVLGDFVFDDNYDLMTYQELESYLKANKHLPGVPAESEVLISGMNVGEMQAKVLQKTEENTLYILDLNNRLEKTEKENKDLEEKNSLLQSELEELKQQQAELEKMLHELMNKK